MKSIAGLQIFYLPWLGLFHQIASVDVFFLADDSQYTRGWINRNRIVNPTGGFTWLTVPIDRAGVETPIRDVRIANTIQWRKKQMHSIEFTHRKAPHFEMLYPRLETEIRLKSEYRLSEDRNQALVDACRQNGAEVYLTGPSARNHLDPELFRANGIHVEYQQFEHPVYPQLGRGEFVTHLSIIDALFMLGVEEVRRIVTTPGSTDRMPDANSGGAGDRGGTR